MACHMNHAWHSPRALAAAWLVGAKLHAGRQELQVPAPHVTDHGLPPALLSHVLHPARQPDILTARDQRPSQV